MSIDFLTAYQGFTGALPGKRELAIAAGLSKDGATFDTALPHDWCEDVLKHTDCWPARYNIVWAYPPGSTWGGPAPLDPEAEMLLRWYEHARTHRCG